MTQPGDREPLVPYIRPNDRIRGSLQAAVTLVEYGDYQCSQCVKSHQLIVAIQVQFSSQFCFIFRHFPRTNLHPLAQHAAEAVEAAASQNKFLEMHDRLFSLPQALDDASLVEHALALGLNVNQFLKEMSEDLHVPRVFEDLENGLKNGVKQTPTFFVNGLRFDGDWEHSALRKAIYRVIERDRRATG
jgi:protein-disulfide isomerase